MHQIQHGPTGYLAGHPAAVAFLEDLVGRMERAVATRDSFTAPDQEFHLMEANASESPVLCWIRALPVRWKMSKTPW